MEHFIFCAVFYAKMNRKVPENKQANKEGWQNLGEMEN